VRRDRSPVQERLRMAPETGRTGRFITFEGGEGVGKSTQMRLLAESLPPNPPVVLTREPGGTPRAELIREFILSGGAKKMGEVTETFLFSAARLDHVRNLVAPALARG